MKYCRIYTMIIAVHFALGMRAQTAGDSITRKVHQLQEVRVEGTAQASKVTTATQVQEMSATRMKDLGMQGLADAVRRFSGTIVKDYGGVGGLKTVSVRNMGAAHTAVSYDGIVVGNSQAGQVDIGKFSLDQLGSISLGIGQVEDPLQSARMYASAGVLQLRTLRPTFQQEKKHQLTAQLKYGSFGTLNPYARYARRWGERTALSVDADWMQSKGNYPFTLVNGSVVTKEHRTNSETKAFHTELNLFHTLKNGAEWQSKLYYYDAERELPGAVILYTQNNKEMTWDRNFFIQTQYRQRLSERWSMQWQGKYNLAWNKYEEANTVRNTFTQNEYYVSGAVAYRPLGGLTLSLAQDAFINTLRSNISHHAHPLRFTSLTAMNAQWTWKRWKVNGTLLYTYKHEHVEVGDRPADLKRLTPTVSVNYQPFAEQLFFVRAMYKNTFRVPTFNDLYYESIGTRTLLPERAQEYSVGLTYAIQPSERWKHASITVDAYYNEVKDKIVAIPTTFVWRMVNYGKARITGVEASLSSTVMLHKHLTIEATGNLTRQSSLNLSDPQEKSYRHQLPYSPQWFGSIGVVARTTWFSVGYTLMGVGKRYSQSQNLPENSVKGYAEQSITVSKLFHWRAIQMRLQAELINFTNEQYSVIQYYPMPGRSWRITASFIL